MASASNEQGDTSRPSAPLLYSLFGLPEVLKKHPGAQTIKSEMTDNHAYPKQEPEAEGK
jgi:hypothetical protein